MIVTSYDYGARVYNKKNPRSHDALPPLPPNSNEMVVDEIAFVHQNDPIAYKAIFGLNFFREHLGAVSDEYGFSTYCT